MSKKAKLNSKFKSTKTTAPKNKRTIRNNSQIKTKPKVPLKLKTDFKEEAEIALKKKETLANKKIKATKRYKATLQKERVKKPSLKAKPKNRVDSSFKKKEITEEVIQQRVETILAETESSTPEKKKTKFSLKSVLAKIKRIRKKTRRMIIVALIVLITAIIILIRFYNSPARMSLVYDRFYQGELVVLNDESIWYVVEDSGDKNAYVKLLRDKPIDINADGKLDDNDKLPFDKDGKYELSYKDENNIAYYLEKVYIPTLENIGKVKNAGLLTSEQYVELRDLYRFGYEWEESNWLASNDMGYWWLETSRNKGVYTVNTKGSYVLYSPTKTSRVRPVITKDKEDIEILSTPIRKK